ncbi:hypothetical protein lerEdw1_008703, partial [Lerista edwardsae]
RGALAPPLLSSRTCGAERRGSLSRLCRPSASQQSEPRRGELRAALMAALLIALLALAGAPNPGAQWTLPAPSNVQHSVDVRHCLLNVTWSPPEARINDTCSLSYESVVWTDGKEALRKLGPPPRIVPVDLRKDVVFGVRAECKTKENEKFHGAWFKVSLPQQGIPGTGAVNIRCVWYNEEYITCSWESGEKAALSSYNLFYGYVDEPEFHMCTNSSREGNDFRCTFSYDKPQGTSILRVLIQGDSEDVPPVCVDGDGFPGKLHPPSIVSVSKDSNGVFLKWTKPADRDNLLYQVEIRDVAAGSVKREPSAVDQLSRSIGLKPNARYTFRVRVKPRENTNDDGWSNWSKEAVWDDRKNTFNILLYIFIPLCVAILTIILLVYLKRIKLIMLPKIPDPGKVLKKMLEEQSEDFQKQPTYDPAKDEQIHSLTLAEPAGSEV